MHSVTLTAKEAVPVMANYIATHSRKNPATVLIDGPSGSGKTSLARALQKASITSRVEGVAVEFITMEDLYQGWTGLAAGNELLADLLQLRAQIIQNGEKSPGTVSLSPWDWHKNRRVGERVIDPFAVWVIEGCGSVADNTVGSSVQTFWVQKNFFKRLIGVRRRERVKILTWLRWECSFHSFQKKQDSKRHIQYQIDE